MSSLHYPNPIEKQVCDNYHRVIENIERTTRNSGRPTQSVKLVVVTKKQPINLIDAVIKAGAIYLGENYADEAQPKIYTFRSNTKISWHMIGHMQSRKAEIISDHFDYIHSLDSLKLAERFNRILKEKGKKLPFLLQFNVSGEETKSGWNASQEQLWDHLLPEIEKIVHLENVEVRGIMTMPPYSDNSEDARPYFRKLVKLRDYLGIKFPGVSWDEVSMGMSGDYEVAIQEGATWIRIGQAILGSRPCNA